LPIVIEPEREPERGKREWYRRNLSKKGRYDSAKYVLEKRKDTHSETLFLPPS
jgi:hypothetical protein